MPELFLNHFEIDAVQPERIRVGSAEAVAGGVLDAGDAEHPFQRHDRVGA